ncbi:MAG: sensor histidine kinase [Actinobacteria bacterium]|nr:sensor histidine kinase [Actinomycetota bacterium]
MEDLSKVKNLVITCDKNGKILGIINEGTKLKESSYIGKDFPSILSKDSFGKSINFIKKIIKNKSAFNCEMLLNTNEGNSLFDFSGISFNTNLLIIATNVHYEMKDFLGGMGEIINEQTNIIRTCNAEKAQISKIERERIAKELHDTVSQTIFSTRVIAEILPDIWEKNRHEAVKQLEKLKVLTAESLFEMRRVLLELRPDAFSDEDINELLRQLVNSAKLRSGINVGLKIKGNGVPGKEIKETVYRITQESLNNAIKHSGAKSVSVVLEYSKNKLNLKISDDGKGFDLNEVAKNKYGIYIMNERANSMNAKLKITSLIGHGTEVFLSCNL